MSIEINGAGVITGVDSLSTPAVTNAAGSASAPSITFTGDGNTGLYSPGADQVAVTTGGTARLFIDSSGRVGIGTASPQETLHLSGTGWVRTQYGSTISATAYNGYLGIQASNYGAMAAGDMSVLTGTSGQNIVLMADSATGTIRFASGGNTERARIDSSGRLLVGTSTASDTGSNLNASNIKTDRIFTGSKTQAANTGNAAQTGSTGWLLNTGANAGQQVTSEATNADSSSGNPILVMRRLGSDGSFISFRSTSDATVGSISYIGSTTSYNTSSDYRLKENVTVVTDGIARLQQLKPSRFNFISNDDRVVDGFLAHEVQAVVPEAITGQKDAVDDDGNPIYQGIDQSKLVPLLTAALQELVAEVESLKVEVAALKAQ